MRQAQAHASESGRVKSLSQLAATSPEALQQLRLSSIYPFGGTLLPDRMLAPNFLYLGQIGSGKTLELRMLMRNVLGTMEWDGQMRTRVRAVAYDAKGEDLFPSLRLWCPPDYLIDLHAYSDTGVALHLGKSCITPEDGEELASALIPETPKSHDFFDGASRQLVQALIHTFQDHGTDWTLSDLLLVATDRKLLSHVVRLHPRGPALLKEFLPDVKDDRTNVNIMQTLANKLGPWRLAGLLERRAEHFITIDGWLESGGVLVLRGSSRNPKTIDLWNAFVFRLLVSRLRDRATNYPLDETFLFIDELPEAILDDYKAALLLGRIKGVRTAATIQDPGGLIARFGGRDQASELLGQVGNLCVGRLQSPDAAEWMARFFGKHEFWQERRDHSWSRGGERSVRVHHELREEFNIYPYEFQTFPRASLTDGYEVVARVPAVSGWRKKLSAQFIDAMLGPQPSNEVVRRRRSLTRADVGYTLGDEDYARLGLPPPEEEQRRADPLLPWNDDYEEDES